MARKALILSCGAYSSPLAKLSSAVPDAERFAALLAKPSIGNFDVRKVLNPTLIEAQVAINDLLASASGTDLDVIYISGHGVKDAYGRFYIALPETNLSKLPATSLSGRFIREQIADTASRLLILMLDTCFAGAFGRDMIAKSVSPAADMPNELIEDQRGHVVMAATSAVQFAFESIEGSPSSIFTKTICEGIETGQADLDGDGWISLEDLFAYVSERMRDDSRAQTPEISYLGLNAPIRIARTRKHTSANEIDDDVSLAAVSAHPELRLAAATILSRYVKGANRHRSSMARARLRGLKNDESDYIRKLVSSSLGRSHRTRQPTVQFKAGAVPSPAATWVSVDGKSLQLAAEQAPSFASFGSDLPVLTAVALRSSGQGELEVFATDRYRLDWRKLSVLASSESPFFALLSANEFAVLRVLPAESEVRIDVFDKEIYFAVSNSFVRLRRELFPEFPGVEPVINNVRPTSSVHRIALIEGIESLICDQHMQLGMPIVISPITDRSSLLVSMQDRYGGRRKLPKISIDAVNLPHCNSLQLDYQRLLEGLDSFTENTIYLDMSRANGPLIILNGERDTTHRHAIMPIESSTDEENLV